MQKIITTKLFTNFWSRLLFTRFFRFSRVTTPRDKKVFRKIWHKIWIEEGYFSYPGQPIAEEFAKYDNFSVDFLLKFLGLLPVGTVRLVYNNNVVGLQVSKDFEVEKPWGNNPVVEITLFTIEKRFRNNYHSALLILMRAVYQYTKQRGIEGLVVAADRRLFHLLIRLGLPFHQIGKEKMYEGSITYPAYLNFQEAEEILAKKNPRLYRFFILR